MKTCAICGGAIEPTDGYTMDYYPERDTYTLHHTKNGAPYCGRGLFKRGETEFTHYSGLSVPLSDVTIVGAPLPAFAPKEVDTFPAGYERPVTSGVCGL